MPPKPIPEYPPGSIVFAKLRGYPWWPARVSAFSKSDPSVTLVLETELCLRTNMSWLWRRSTANGVDCPRSRRRYPVLCYSLTPRFDIYIRLKTNQNSPPKCCSQRERLRPQRGRCFSLVQRTSKYF
jgi:PWWP domain